MLAHASSPVVLFVMNEFTKTKDTHVSDIYMMFADRVLLRKLRTES